MANMKCAVNGMIRPGAMCGAVIVVNKTCCFDGACEHQRKDVIQQPDGSTNSCQKSNKLVEKDCCDAHHHRYAGSFGG